MKASTLTEVLWACTMSHYVDGDFIQRGGILLVAPPGQFKTQFLNALDRVPGTRLLSDMTTNDLKSIRDQIGSRDISTLVFLDMQKLYERRQDTAHNIVGNIRALIDEGYVGSTQDTNQELRAHATVIGACTPSFKRTVWQAWVDNGMARRLIVSLFYLKNPREITHAIAKGKRLSVSQNTSFLLPFEKIPNRCTEEESAELLYMLRHQEGRDTPLIMLQKIVSVLRWKYKQAHQLDRSMLVMRDFQDSLGKHGAELELDK